MLSTALADPNPVIIFEHATLYNEQAPLTECENFAVDIHSARVRRPGNDVTLITYGGSLPKTLAAAETLAAEGISCEVIDLRSLRPIDDLSIMASLAKTHRAVVVDEGWRSVGLAAEISARITEQAFFDLDGPVARVCSAERTHPLCAALRDGGHPTTRKDSSSSPEGDAPMSEFCMPSLGADMETGRLVEWLKSPRAEIKRGDVIAVVERRKARSRSRLSRTAFWKRSL